MQSDNGEDNQANWTYQEEDESIYTAPNERSAAEPVTWTASEFVDHQKDGKWYSTVIGGALVLCVLLVVIARDFIAAVAIFIVTILFVIIAKRKPRQQQYMIDDHGVTIGTKFYPFSDFKSFSIDEDSVIGSISFIPLKRFMPELSIHFAPEDEDRILDVLAISLPNDQRREQSVDRLMKRMRF